MHRAEASGAGLGLHICRELAEKMRGEISVDSEPGEGSTFTFTGIFAIAEAEEAKKGVPEPSQLKRGRKERFRILIVEDEKTNQLYLQELLDHPGNEVDMAADGSAAVEEAKQKPYDLILMDVRLPGMSGIEATKRIREHEKNIGREPVAIIALSAFAMKGDEKEFLEAGMDGYVSKPIQVEQLRRSMREVTGLDVALSIEEEQETGFASELPDDEVDREQAIEQAITEKYRDSTDLLQEIVAQALTDLQKRKNDLSEAVDNGDAQALAKVAHSLSNIAGTLKATELDDSANRLEAAAREERWPEIHETIDELDPHLESVLRVLRKLNNKHNTTD
jgi:CheY-like chemotaxis protein